MDIILSELFIVYCACAGLIPKAIGTDFKWPEWTEFCVLKRSLDEFKKREAKLREAAREKAMSEQIVTEARQTEGEQAASINIGAGEPAGDEGDATATAAMLEDGSTTRNNGDAEESAAESPTPSPSPPTAGITPQNAPTDVSDMLAQWQA